MRLRKVRDGHSLPVRLFFDLVRSRSGDDPPDVARTFYYRPLLFGLPFLTLLQEAMRGPSDWSVGERELFATYTAELNQCVF